MPARTQRGPYRSQSGLCRSHRRLWPCAQGIKGKEGLFPWTASGRAVANGRDEGGTKPLFDHPPEAHGHRKITGSGVVGTHAGGMIGEISLVIGKTIRPHPALESIGMAAELAHGSCTDLLPSKRQMRPA